MIIESLLRERLSEWKLLVLKLLSCRLFAGKRAGGKGKGGGGGGRGVRGVDYGLGIGYSHGSGNAASQPPSNRTATVNALRTGMMAQFKSSFVAASSNPQSAGGNSSNTSASRRSTLPGFVSGGSIGGLTSAPHRSNSNLGSTFKPGGNLGDVSDENGTQRNSER